MKQWLRRNWIGLVAVTVLLPATVGITFAAQWGGYFDSRASAPTTVPNGDTADFAGTGWSVENFERVAGTSSEGTEIGLPAGTDLVVVTVRVSPDRLDDDGESPFCRVSLEEYDGTTLTRSWDETATPPVSYRTADDAESYCTTSIVEPYLLESTFVVPSDAGDDFAIALTVSSELPRYLSLRL